MMRHTLRLALLAVSLFASAAPALAQEARSLRLSATITAVQGNTLRLKSAEGELSVNLSATTPVYVQAAASLKDIRPGSFLGVGAMPQPDGSQQAIRVMIFPEALRGQGEGHRPWTRPGSTMTNATVETAVTQVNGQELKVRYAGGEQRIVIRPDAEIVTYAEAPRSELKPGTAVTVSGVLRAGNVMEAERVFLGR